MMSLRDRLREEAKFFLKTTGKTVKTSYGRVHHLPYNVSAKSINELLGRMAEEAIIYPTWLDKDGDEYVLTDKHGAPLKYYDVALGDAVEYRGKTPAEATGRWILERLAAWKKYEVEA